MKILVTGANGMLGSEVCPVLRREGHHLFMTDITGVEGTSLRYLDICDFASVKSTIDELKPDLIVHLAAETDVDKCETEKEHAYMVNAHATRNIACICKEKDIILVYISTAAVFDGEKGSPYVETDEPNPHSIYAKSKLEGERAVSSLLDRFFILRAGWMVGGVEKDKKFVAKILKILEKKSELNVVNDAFGSLTFIKDFVICLARLITTDKYNIYHVVNKGVCSRFNIAERIVKCFGREDIAVNPVSSDEFLLPAPRGRFEMLENRRLQELKMDDMRPWQEALEEYILEWRKKKGNIK